jgi:hypothetical protein
LFAVALRDFHDFTAFKTFLMQPRCPAKCG